MLNWWLEKNCRKILHDALIWGSLHMEDDISIELLILEVLDGTHGFKLSSIGQYLLSVYKNNFVPHIIKQLKSIDESTIKSRDIDGEFKRKVFKSILEYHG